MRQVTQTNQTEGVMKGGDINDVLIKIGTREQKKEKRSTLLRGELLHTHRFDYSRLI